MTDPTIGSRWKARGGSGDAYELTSIVGAAYTLTTLIVAAGNYSSIGDEMTVDRAWFDVRGIEVKS